MPNRYKASNFEARSYEARRITTRRKIIIRLIIGTYILIAFGIAGTLDYQDKISQHKINISGAY